MFPMAPKGSIENDIALFSSKFTYSVNALICEPVSRLRDEISAEALSVVHQEMLCAKGREAGLRDDLHSIGCYLAVDESPNPFIVIGQVCSEAAGVAHGRALWHWCGVYRYLSFGGRLFRGRCRRTSGFQCFNDPRGRESNLAEGSPDDHEAPPHFNTSLGGKQYAVTPGNWRTEKEILSFRELSLDGLFFDYC